MCERERVQRVRNEGRRVKQLYFLGYLKFRQCWEKENTVSPLDFCLKDQVKGSFLRSCPAAALCRHFPLQAGGAPVTLQSPTILNYQQCSVLM